MRYTVFIILFFLAFNLKAQQSVFQGIADNSIEKILDKVTNKMFENDSFEKFKSQRNKVEQCLNKINFWVVSNKISEEEYLNLKNVYNLSEKNYNLVLSNSIAQITKGIKSRGDLKKLKKEIGNDSIFFVDQTNITNKNLDLFYTEYSKLETKLEIGTKGITGNINLNDFTPTGILLNLSKRIVEEVSTIDYKTSILNGIKKLQSTIIENFGLPIWDSIVINPNTMSTTLKNDEIVELGNNYPVNSEFEAEILFEKIVGNNYEKINLIKQMSIDNKIIYFFNDEMTLNEKFRIIFDSNLPAYILGFNTELNHWEILNIENSCKNLKKQKEFFLESKKFNKKQQYEFIVEGDNPYKKEMLMLIFSPYYLGDIFFCGIEKIDYSNYKAISEFQSLIKRESSVIDLNINEANLSVSKSLRINKNENETTDLSTQILYFEIPRK